MLSLRMFRGIITKDESQPKIVEEKEVVDTGPKSNYYYAPKPHAHAYFINPHKSGVTAEFADVYTYTDAAGDKRFALVPKDPRLVRMLQQSMRVQRFFERELPEDLTRIDIEASSQE